MDSWPEENRFFWKRYEDRAFSKLDGKEGVSQLKLFSQKIRISKFPGRPQHLCMVCGSHLRRRHCNNCTDLLDLHEKNKLYFVIDHFKGDNYKVIFFNDIKDTENKISPLEL